MGIFRKKQKLNDDPGRIECFFSQDHLISPERDSREQLNECAICKFPLFSETLVKVLKSGQICDGEIPKGEVGNSSLLLFAIFWAQSDKKFTITGRANDDVWGSHNWERTENGQWQLLETLNALESFGSEPFGQLTHLKPWLVSLGSNCLEWWVNKDTVLIQARPSLALLTEKNFAATLALKEKLEAEYPHLEIWQVINYLLLGVNVQSMAETVYEPFEAEIEYLIEIETEERLGVWDSYSEIFDFSRIPIYVLNNVGLYHPNPDQKCIGPFDLEFQFETIRVIELEPWEVYEETRWQTQVTAVASIKLKGVRVKPHESRLLDWGYSDSNLNSLATAIQKSWSFYIFFDGFEKQQGEDFRLLQDGEHNISWPYMSIKSINSDKNFDWFRNTQWHQ